MSKGSLNLEQQRKRAKDLRRAHRDGDLRAAQRIVASLPRARGHAPAQLLAAGFTLSEAQLVVAREAGFASWPALKHALERATVRRGGPIMVGRRKQGRENINVYSCGWRRDRGAAVCSNKAVAPVVEVDAAVIEGVRRYITPEVATEVLRQVRAILKERTAAAPGETAQLAAEVTKLKQEAARYLRAIGATDEPPDMLVEALADANKRLRRAESQLAAVESVSTVLDAELDNLEREVHQRLATLHAEFVTSPSAAKNVLKTLTGQARLKFAPDNGKFRIEGPIAVPEPLVSGTGDFKLDGVPSGI